MNQIQDFQLLKQFIDEMNVSNSSLEKIKVLEKYKDEQFISQILFYTYNPFFNYYVKSENCIKRSELKFDNYDIIFQLLSDLKDKNISGHTAIQCINGFIENYKDYKDIIYKIIDRNLEIRIDSKTINKVFKDLIPIYSCSLCETLDEKSIKKINLDKDRWLVSRKLDGVRCQLIIDENGNINTYSREGKEFKTLEKIKECFVEFAKENRNIVFDGEICIVNEDGTDNFAGVIRQIMKKNYTIENAKYYIFDCIPLDVFNGRKRGFDFMIRQDILKRYLGEINNCNLVQLEQIPLETIDDIDLLKEIASENNWEGLILRKDCEYKGKRSFDLLKVKQWIDSEFIVMNIETGPFRVIKNGVEETIETMTNVVICLPDHEDDDKSYRVSVGSGFSLEQRNEFYKDSSKISGKQITVKYFEKTRDINGNLSLRFPIFKGIRDYE